MTTEKKDAIALRPGSGMQLRTVKEHKEFAMAAFASGFLQAQGTGEEAKKTAVATAMMKIQYGAEVGVGPMSAIQNIHVIQGRPAMAANLMAALVKGSGKYLYKILEHNEKVCKLEFYERLGAAIDIAGESTFTIEDAANAGLTTGSNKHSWKKYPRNMLFARAMSNGARWYCADIFCGAVYLPDEVEEASIEASYTVEPEPESKTSRLMADVQLIDRCKMMAGHHHLADTMIAVQLGRVDENTTIAAAEELVDQAEELVMARESAPLHEDDSGENDEIPPEEFDDGTAPEPGSNG
jgi:hypothetical protein